MASAAAARSPAVVADVVHVLKSGEDAKRRRTGAEQAAPRTPAQVILLDGGMGHQLKKMGVTIEGEVGSMKRFLGVAVANVEKPELVRDAHLAYIDAGADVITTNTYSCVPKCLSNTTHEMEIAEKGLDGIIAAAGRIARHAQSLRPERRVLVAGSLPPLAESYRPDKVGPYEENLAQYRTIVRSLAPFADILLCETMSTADEGRAACTAALDSGKPVWVSWTLKEEEAVLRSGESIQEAVAALALAGGGEIPEAVEACMFNCTSPEIIIAAMPLLRQALPARVRVGGYANGFVTASSGTGEYRDISAEEYSIGFGRRWMEDGASIIGGCCGIFPSHIALLRKHLDASAQAEDTEKEPKADDTKSDDTKKDPKAEVTEKENTIGFVQRCMKGESTVIGS